MNWTPVLYTRVTSVSVDIYLALFQGLPDSIFMMFKVFLNLVGKGYEWVYICWAAENVGAQLFPKM